MIATKSNTKLTDQDIFTIKCDVIPRDSSISINNGTSCRKRNNKEFIEYLIHQKDLNPLTIWYIKACSYLNTKNIDLRQVDHNIKQLKDLKLI